MTHARKFLIAAIAAACLPGMAFVHGQDPPQEPKPAEAKTVEKQPAQEAAPGGATTKVKVITIQVVPAQKVAEEPKKAEPAEEKAQVVEVRKDAVVMEKVAVGVGEPNAAEAAALDAQTAQYLQQFRPIFRAEYYFIRNACDLDSEQRKKLARLGEQTSRDAARQFVQAQQKMMRGGWRPGMEYPDPRKLIEESLTKSLDQVLTTDQQARYKDEAGKRAESRKETVVNNLVAKLDQDLVLSADQREKLVEVIKSNWKDGWGQSLEMLSNIENYFPSIPDQVVSPILSSKQNELWRRIPKNPSFFWGFSFNGMGMEPDALDDPELTEARQEAEQGEKDKVTP